VKIRESQETWRLEMSVDIRHARGLRKASVGPDISGADEAFRRASRAAGDSVPMWYLGIIPFAVSESEIVSLLWF
jgi:hypothetical protein